MFPGLFFILFSIDSSSCFEDIYPNWFRRTPWETYVQRLHDEKNWHLFPLFPFKKDDIIGSVNKWRHSVIECFECLTGTVNYAYNHTKTMMVDKGLGARFWPNQTVSVRHARMLIGPHNRPGKKVRCIAEKTMNIKLQFFSKNSKKQWNNLLCFIEWKIYLHPDHLPVGATLRSPFGNLSLTKQMTYCVRKKTCPQWFSCPKNLLPVLFQIVASTLGMYGAQMNFPSQLAAQLKTLWK